MTIQTKDGLQAPMVQLRRRSLLALIGLGAASVALDTLNGGFPAAHAQTPAEGDPVSDDGAPRSASSSGMNVGSNAGADERTASSEPPISSNASGPAGASASDRAPVLLVLGDSLSAEYGLRRGQGWVALLGERIQQQAGKLKHQEWRVVNASISGETTVGGRTRLPRLLQQHRPALTLIELGGNDGLRGLPIQTVSANLRQMIESAQAQGSQVLLIGMQMPPNYGPAYARQFQQMYQSLARDTGSALVPFLLEGFGSDRDWFQPDGIHPNATAQPKMLDNVWPTLKPLL